MAIKFSFTLNDGDACNLIDVIHSEKCRILECVEEEMVGENRPAFIQWYKNHVAYLGRLQQRVLSSQVNVPDSQDLDLEDPPPPPQDSPGEPL